MSDDEGPLAGLRVTDCGTYIAGPAAAVAREVLLKALAAADVFITNY